LPTVIERGAAMLDVKSRNRIETLLALVTPTITIIMGGLIGWLAISIMDALLSVNEFAL